MDPNDPNFDGMHSDFDNQTSYKHPRAWRNAKREMEKMANGLPDLVKQLEAVARADGLCIRLALRAAIFGYVNQDKGSRMEDWQQSYRKDDGSTAKPAKAKATKETSDDSEDNDDWEKEGEEWKEVHAEAPSETLPATERISNSEFMAAMWKACAPAWPMPAGLPDSIRILEVLDGSPPVVVGGSGATLRLYCPCCGKAYKDFNAGFRHIEKKHGKRMAGNA